jgi:hypothetical protein
MEKMRRLVNASVKFAVAQFLALAAGVIMDEEGLIG